MADILLVFPETRYKNGQLPLGIAYAGAACREAGHDVTLVDLSHLRKPGLHLERLLRSRDYSMVGVSVVTPHIRMAKMVSRIVKSISPKTTVIWGGAHATVMPVESAENRDVDIVLRGEAEHILPSLAEDPLRRDLPGLVYRDETGISSSGNAIPIEDLNTLPFPARDLLDMDEYIRYWYSLDAISPRIRGTGIMASRGCPFKCSFCQPTLSLLFGKRTRKRSPENIAAELETLKRDYDIQGFMFEDSTFVLDKSWVLDVCDAIRDLNLIWCCNIRADLVDEDFLMAMSRAGLRKVNIGIESAVQEVLDVAYQKQITIEQVNNVVRWSRKIGLKVQGYFILGVPIETRDDMLKTVKYATNLDIDDAVFDIATPFPETIMYNKWKEHVTADFADFDCFHKSVFENLQGVSKEWIERQKKLAYYRFYLHPRRWPHVFRMLTSPTGIRRTLMKARRV